MSWRRLAAQRSFRRLWLGDAVSLLGDWFTYVAVGALAMSEGTGSWAVALVLLAHTLPRALVAPVAGRLADRHDRRTIMVVTSLLRAVVVLGMIAAAGAGATTAVQALLFVRMALGAFIDPAASAALPQLVPAEQLARANALLGATWSVIFAVGVGVGGVVTSLLGPVAALAIDATTFVIAAGVLATLPPLRPGELDADARRPGHDPSGHVPSGKAADRGGLGDAWALVRREPAIFAAALAKLPAALANGGAWIFLHALAGRQQLGTAALALGALHGARAAGTGLGPLAWARSARLRGSALGLDASAWLTFTAVGLFTLADAPGVALVAALLWGAGIGTNWVTASTRVQTLTPNHLLGRVSSIDLTAHTLGGCLGGLGGALLADCSRVPEAAGWFGLGGGVVAWQVLRALARRGAARGSPRAAAEDRAA